MSSASRVLRLAQNAVKAISSNTRPSDGSALRKLAKAIQDSQQRAGVRRIPLPAKDLHDDDERLENLLRSIHAPLNRLSQQIQHQEDAAGGEELETRKQFKASSNSTYGETPAHTIRTLLAAIQRDHHHSNNDNNEEENGGGKPLAFVGNFVDVGSGNGAATVAAAMTGQFQTAKGMEYDSYRHQESLLLLEAYRNCSNSTTTPTTSVEFHLGDIGQHGEEFLKNASVVFCNSVTWNATLSSTMGQLLDDVQLASPGIVVTISKRFPCPTFDLVDILQMECNGGEDFSFYVCQKVAQYKGSGDRRRRIAAGSTRSLAVSDSLEVVALLEEDAMLRTILGDFVQENEKNSDEDRSNKKRDSMAVFAVLGASESATRFLLENDHLLVMLGKELNAEFETSNLVSRASSSMVLRAISDFPVGRRAIAESDEVMGTLFSSMSAIDDNDADASIQEQQSTKDHPAIRANVLDILGQVLKDPVGHEAINGIDKSGGIDFDGLLEENTAAAKANGWAEVLEAAREVQVMRRWWQGQSMPWGGGFTFRVLRD